jgi:hypothetical protein
MHVLRLPHLYVGVVGSPALLWLVDRWPQQLWQLAGVSAALAGAVAGYLFDEPAASIVDTMPRARWWRTLARLLPVALLVVVWVAAASLVGPRDIGRSDVLRLQGVGTILLGAAISTWLRRTGRSSPGPVVASTLLLVLTFAAVMNPIDEELPLFPYGPEGDWTASHSLWIALAIGAAVALAASTSEGWPAREGGRHTGPGDDVGLSRSSTQRGHIKGGA